MDARSARVSLRMILVFAGLVALAVAAVYAVRAMTLPLVQVTTLVRGDVVEAFYATGTIQPEREFPIRAQVSGVLQWEPGVDKGRPVVQGQLLGRVVSDDLAKKLKQAAAELKEKQKRADEKESPVVAEFDHRIAALVEILASTRREYQRLLKLAETNNAQPVEVDRAFERVKSTESELEAARSQRKAKILELNKDLDVAQANLDIARWNIDQQELRSPVDGLVLDWPVSSRTRVAVNDALMTVADVRPEKMVMRAQVDEEDRTELHVGQLVRMTLYSFGQGQFTGRVKTIYPKADPQRRTFEVDVEIDRQPAATRPTTAPAPGVPDAGPVSTSPATRPCERFAAGMTGELAFIIRERYDCRILPRQALQGQWFYVVKHGKVDRVPAQAGLKDVARVEVLGGLDEMIQVVISPASKLEPGQSVRTHVVDPRAAAEANKPKDTGVFKGGF